MGHQQGLPEPFVLFREGAFVGGEKDQMAALVDRPEERLLHSASASVCCWGGPQKGSCYTNDFCDDAAAGGENLRRHPYGHGAITR